MKNNVNISVHLYSTFKSLAVNVPQPELHVLVLRGTEAALQKTFVTTNSIAGQHSFYGSNSGSATLLYI
jgi:hypothetical protein